MPVKEDPETGLPDAPWQLFMNMSCVARRLGISKEWFRKVTSEEMAKGGSDFPSPVGYVQTHYKSSNTPIWRDEQMPDIVKWWEQRKTEGRQHGKHGQRE